MKSQIQQYKISDYLLTDVKAGDKIIETTAGVFKIRKNGKYRLILSAATEDEEIIRATKTK